MLRDEKEQPRTARVAPLPWLAFFRECMQSGKLDEGILAFRDEMGKIAEGSTDTEVAATYEKVRYVEGAKDIWNIIGALIRFLKSEGEETERIVLEVVMTICYEALSAHLIWHNYEFEEAERSEVQEPVLDRRKAILKAWGNLPSIDQASRLLREACKRLAEIHRDKELQLASGTLDETDDLLVLHDFVVKLMERHGDEGLRHNSRSMIAHIDGELIVHYGRSGNTGRAQLLYDGLKQMAQRDRGQRGQQELTRAQARGAINLIYAYVTAKMPDEARAVYLELRELLTKSHPENSSLRFAQANRAADIVYAYAVADRSEAARIMYQGLRDLVQKHPEEPRLRIWQAEGALDLASVYVNLGKREEARMIFRELEQLTAGEEIASKIQRRKNLSGAPVIERLRELLYEA